MNISTVIERSGVPATLSGVLDAGARSVKQWPAAAVAAEMSASTLQSARTYGRLAITRSSITPFVRTVDALAMAATADHNVPATDRPPRGAPA